MKIYSVSICFVFGSGVPGWIGLSENTSSPGAYRWLEDSYPDWANWNTGYPDSMGGCVMITTDGLWENTDCNLAYEFVCFTLKG